MKELNEHIEGIEEALRALSADTTDTKQAHRRLRDSIQRLALIAPDESLSLAESFKAIALNSHGTTKRDVGIIAIRLVNSAHLLPKDSIAGSDRYMMEIIEEGCGDLLSKVLPDKRTQTHEKLKFVSNIHTSACEHLANLRQPFSNLKDLNGRRQLILRELNHGPTKAYLSAFNFKSVLSTVTSRLTLVAGVSHSEGEELQENLQSLLESVQEDLAHYKKVPTFVVSDYLLPFLQAILDAASNLQASLVDRFDCRIQIPEDPYKLEKKYPLHLVGLTLQVYVPLRNEGPGVAQNVVAHCLGEHCDVRTEETRLGNVVPGPLVLTLIFRVTEPRERIELDVAIHWDVIGRVSTQVKEFALIVDCQRTDLDWGELSFRQPYSLEVAYGNDFFGREDTVRRIVRRLAPNAMQSTYITGQKRVGKSSLARAVEMKIQKGIHPGLYHVLYLECGEIRHAAGEDTLKALGTGLDDFISQQLPHSSDRAPPDYSSSLAPLNRLLDQLLSARPESRFVIILDEFDEINENLYRYGELANTFFLNIRTISSKKNIAFVLVGAERMPYLMAAQGEKLNRFERELLNSFDRDKEWADYVDLVRKPVKDIIEAHESALFALFRFTNGHPYFTKVLCATVYECAVEAKDAEVTNNEVENAARRVVATLDANAFAHYWRDGIRGDAEEVEIVSLKRRRLLLACARTARSRKPLTWESIQANIHSGSLNGAEVLPLLEDFCRRGVFREDEGSYLPTVVLFADWLIEFGFSVLVADQLGDELAEAKQKIEDAAYVRSEEMVALTVDWDLYQGRQITSDNVRAWLGQVESNVEQRILFKVLQNIRFFRDTEVREKFEAAHAWIRGRLPVVVKKSRAQRREDIVVSFADGPGKSGAYYAALYANTNEIVSDNVVAPSALGKKFAEIEQSKPRGLVFVDDMIGTGNNLVGRFRELSESFSKLGIGTNIPVSLVVLCSTATGERQVRKYLSESMSNADLEICEILGDKHFAFGNTLGFWESEEERDFAKSLLTDLGVRIQKRNPLGFGDQGLLLTFSRNCPNNSLPILHGFGKLTGLWSPLFPRMKS